MELERDREFRLILAADKDYQRLKKKSADLAAKRGSMAAGSTRARVTTANANWARAAEARDRCEERLRREWEADERSGQANPRCGARMGDLIPGTAD